MPEAMMTKIKDAVWGHTDELHWYIKKLLACSNYDPEVL